MAVCWGGEHKGSHQLSHTDVLPDLILLTLDCDAVGLGFVRMLKAEQEWRTIPVVVFSGGTGPQEAEAVYASGVSVYMTKPLDFEGHIFLASELAASFER